MGKLITILGAKNARILTPGIAGLMTRFMLTAEEKKSEKYMRSAALRFFGFSVENA